MNNSRRTSYVVSLHFNSVVFCAFIFPIEKRNSRLLLFVTQYRSRSEYRYFAFLPILRAFKTVSDDVRYTMEQISIANIYLLYSKRNVIF